MKALVIGSGDFYCSFDTAGYTVIACDGGLDHCREHKIEPDYILGDFDSVTSGTLEYFKNCEKTQYPKRKDQTDLELGIRLAAELGAEDLTVTGALSASRFDHSLCNIQLLRICLEKGISARIINKNNTIMLAAPERSLTLENTGRYISLIPLTETAEGISLSGFEYPLSGHTLPQGSSLCVSNLIKEKTGTISLEKGILIVISAED